MKQSSSQSSMDIKNQSWDFCSQALSINDPNVQELNSVPQASGNVSPEIAKSHWVKQSPLYVKESKGNVNTSIGGRPTEWGFLSEERVKGKRQWRHRGDVRSCH